jgi:hypothetical protein
VIDRCQKAKRDLVEPQFKLSIRPNRTMVLPTAKRLLRVGMTNTALS